MIRVTDAIVLDDREIEERFVRAAGPGGQNVNKVATAVDLRFDIGKSSLPPDVKERLIGLAGRRMTTDGVLVIDSRVHRSQAQNRAAARVRLVALFEACRQAAKETQADQAARGRAREEARLEEAAERGQTFSRPPG